jgi:hypothetical protein
MGVVLGLSGPVSARCGKAGAPEALPARSLRRPHHDAAPLALAGDGNGSADSRDADGIAGMLPIGRSANSKRSSGRLAACRGRPRGREADPRARRDHPCVECISARDPVEFALDAIAALPV